MLNAIDENNNYMGNLYKRILVHIFNKVVRIRGRNNNIVAIIHTVALEYFFIQGPPFFIYLFLKY